MLEFINFASVTRCTFLKVSKLLKGFQAGKVIFLSHFHRLPVVFSTNCLNVFLDLGKLKAHLNGFIICFNIYSTLCWTKRRGHLNRSFNIVESVKNFESLLKARWIKFKYYWFKLSFNNLTSIQLFLCPWKCWMALKPFKHSIQHLSNLCPTSVRLL